MKKKPSKKNFNTSLEPTPAFIALQKILDIAGGQSKLAKKLEISQPSIFRWIQNGKVPAGRVSQLVKIFKGSVTADELLSD